MEDLIWSGWILRGVVYASITPLFFDLDEQELIAGADYFAVFCRRGP